MKFYARVQILLKEVSIDEKYINESNEDSGDILHNSDNNSYAEYANTIIY